MAQDTLVCRFCLDSKTTKMNPLLDPCDCKGSIQFVHEKCLYRWRRMDPARNGEMCLICLVPYRLLQPGILEMVPDGGKITLMFLRFPLLLCFVVNYGLILQISFIPKKDIYDVFKVYQYVFQVLYMAIFWKEWNVRNKALYWSQWQHASTLFLFFAFLFCNGLLYQGQYVAILPLNFLLGLSWHRHRNILHALNSM